jgi:UDP-N-acetylglucosamine 2-epimerase (non-hydrolysing)
LLALITGTRPEIIKMFPVMKQLDKENIEYKYIHTGQHYDSTLSTQFFYELNIRSPDYSVNIDKSTNNWLQVIDIKNKLAKIFNNERFSSVLVQGDTNSTLGASLAAYDAKIPIYHVEAGLRCFDTTLQEEINRIIVDKISNVLFAPTKDSLQNLVDENIAGKIFVVGNTVMDSIKLVIEKDKKMDHLQVIFKSDMEQRIEKKYVLITMHRAANLQNKEFLFNFFTTLRQSKLSFVFPIHPHTIKQMKKFDLIHLLESDNIKTIPPVGYYEFLSLVKGSTFVITDSGGLQEEITSNLINKKAIILRPNTERPESIRSGHSILLKDFSTESLTFEMDELCKKIEIQDDQASSDYVSPYGTGDSSEQIVKIIKMLKDESAVVMNRIS